MRVWSKSPDIQQDYESKVYKNSRIIKCYIYSVFPFSFFQTPPWTQKTKMKITNCSLSKWWMQSKSILISIMIFNGISHAQCQQQRPKWSIDSKMQIVFSETLSHFIKQQTCLKTHCLPSSAVKTPTIFKTTDQQLRYSKKIL